LTAIRACSSCADGSKPTGRNWRPYWFFARRADSERTTAYGAQPRRCRAIRRRSLHHTFADLAHGALATGSLRSNPGKPAETKPPESKARDHEGGQGFGEVHEIFVQAPASSEPGKGALDHPARRQNNEALHVIAPLDDLHAQQRHLWHGHPPTHGCPNPFCGSTSKKAKSWGTITKLDFYLLHFNGQSDGSVHGYVLVRNSRTRNSSLQFP